MRALLMTVTLVSLAACHQPHRTTADGLPVSDKPGVTGDGLPAGHSARAQ